MLNGRKIDPLEDIKFIFKQDEKYAEQIARLPP